MFNKGKHGGHNMEYRMQAIQNILFSRETSKSPQNASNTELYSSKMFNKEKHGAYLKSRYPEPQTKATVNTQQII